MGIEASKYLEALSKNSGYNSGGLVELPKSDRVSRERGDLYGRITELAGGEILTLKGGNTAKLLYMKALTTLATLEMLSGSEKGKKIEMVLSPDNVESIDNSTAEVRSEDLRR
jgi:hypothetical protein